MRIKQLLQLSLVLRLSLSNCRDALYSLPGPTRPQVPCVPWHTLEFLTENFFGEYWKITGEKLEKKRGKTTENLWLLGAAPPDPYVLVYSTL